MFWSNNVLTMPINDFSASLQCSWTISFIFFINGRPVKFLIMDKLFLNPSWLLCYHLCKILQEDHQAQQHVELVLTYLQQQCFHKTSQTTNKRTCLPFTKFRPRVFKNCQFGPKLTFIICIHETLKKVWAKFYLKTVEKNLLSVIFLHTHITDKFTSDILP